jgi:hypothetical protein
MAIACSVELNSGMDCGELATPTKFATLLRAELISAPAVTRLCNVPSRHMAQFNLSWTSNETSPNVRRLQDRTFGFARRHNRTSGWRVTQILPGTLVRMSGTALLPRRSGMTGSCLTPRVAARPTAAPVSAAQFILVAAGRPTTVGNQRLKHSSEPRRMPFGSDALGSDASALTYQDLSMLGLVMAIGSVSTTRSWWSRTWSGSSSRDCHRSPLPLRQCGKSLE